MRRKLACYIMAIMVGISIFLPIYDHTFPACLPSEEQISGIVSEVEWVEDDFYRILLTSSEGNFLLNYYQKIQKPWGLIGSRITAKGSFQLPPEAGNPKTFDYRRYLKSRDIAFTGTMDFFVIQEQKKSIAYRLKGHIMQSREAYIESLRCTPLSEGLLRGILFGDKTGLDEDVYDEFRRNGTAHILAVSGLHVGLLYNLYKKIYGKRRSFWITIAFLIFLFIYGSACLWTVSVTRAIGLILIVTIGNILDRRYDLLTALSAMAGFSIIKNPYVIYGASFQMSFLAVLSIVFLQPFFEKWVGQKWAVSMAVQVGLMPYMAYNFNYISFVGILCNIPVIYLASFIVPLGMAGFICYFIGGFTLPVLAPILDTLTKLMIWCNHLFTADGIFSFDVISPPLWLICIIYGVLLFFTSEYFQIYISRKEWKRIVLPLLCILLLTCAVAVDGISPFNKADLIFVDVGQGDCVHLKVSKNIDVLIDGGGKIGYNTGEKTLKPYLLKNGVKDLDLAAATHLHTDHYQGLVELCACYPVANMITKGKAGQVVKLGDDCYIELLWPLERNPNTDDENENSLIFMIHQRGVKTLITGDITAEGEQLLLKQYKGTRKLEADILKIAHHGSAYSTCDSFLDQVKPKIAVISVGKNNYGHPSEIVIEKLEKRGIMVFRTDLHGAVGIINQEGNISVCTKKQR